MPKNHSELNVLIADDEPDICSMVKFALQTLGIS
jgi:CheY-like chemotaxis protein